MTPSPVGMRCPECARQTTKVKRMPAPGEGEQPIVTIALIVICVAAFLAEGSIGSSPSGALYRNGALFGPAVDGGDYYRLITSGFLHAGIFHIGFNMWLLWLLGQQLEPEMGSPRFGALYFASLLGGSAVALLVDPLAFTVGASGAVFGLMGAFAAILFSRGINPMQTGIGWLIVLNLVISFAVPNISWGGHVGGLIAGTLIGLAFERGRRLGQGWIFWAACVGVAAAAVAGALAVAGGNGL
jgi:membrane associated rhomboid family serine protease